MKRVAAILVVIVILCALTVGCQSETYTLASGVYYPEGFAPEDLIAPSIRIDGEEFRLSLNPLMSYSPWGTVSKEGNYVKLHCVSEDFSLDFRLIGDNKLQLLSDATTLPELPTHESYEEVPAAYDGFEIWSGGLESFDWTDGMVFVLVENLP